MALNKKGKRCANSVLCEVVQHGMTAATVDSSIGEVSLNIKAGHGTIKRGVPERGTSYGQVP